MELPTQDDGFVIPHLKQDVAAPTLLHCGSGVLCVVYNIQFYHDEIQPPFRQTMSDISLHGFGTSPALIKFTMLPPPSAHAENLQSNELVPEPARFRSRSGVSVRRQVARCLNCGGEHGLNVCGATGVVGMLVGTQSAG